MIGACPVIACPRTRQGRSLALSIAEQAADLTGKTVLPLDFSMARDPESRRGCYDAAARQITDCLASGRDVAFLTLGDVSVYSTFSYIADPVREAGYTVERIPGVTSFCAAAARLGVPLTEGEEPLCVIPAGRADLETELDRPGTRVLMKAGKNVPETAELLRRKGLADRTALAADCGLPGERVFYGLDGLPEDLGYFATFIVKE